MTSPIFNVNINTDFTVNMADIAESPTYLSIPVVFTKEGVHNGYLKPYDTLKQKATELIGKPVIIGHPKTAGKDRPIDVKRDAVTGEVETCEARDSDKSLHGRIRIEKAKAPAWLIQAIKQGYLRGGSPGYWHNTRSLGGFYQGKPYSGVEEIVAWDHYAIGLEDGAASVKDGVGLRFNSSEDQEVVTMGRLKMFLEHLKPKGKGDKNVPENDVEGKFERKFEKLETQIEELMLKNKELQQKLGDSDKLRGDTEKKLKDYQDKEAKLEADKRDVVLKTLLEGTQDKAEDYKEFSTTQLEFLKSKLAPKDGAAEANPVVQPLTPSADKTALKPPVIGQSGKASRDVAGTELTIGNSLFGKKMGES